MVIELIKLTLAVLYDEKWEKTQHETIFIHPVKMHVRRKQRVHKMVLPLEKELSRTIHEH